MSWLLEGLVTLITGSMLIIFRVWLETKWKINKMTLHKNPLT